MDNLEAVVDFVQGVLGTVTGLQPFPGEHSHSQVIRVQSERSGNAFLKFHRTDKSFRQELGFYRKFAPKLPQVPRLLGTMEKERALLLSALEGAPCRTMLLADRGHFHHMAGKFLRTLHQLPAEDDDIEVHLALHKRLEAFEQRARPVFGEDTLSSFVAPLKQLLSAPPTLTRVPCHRDFLEHNWLTSGSEDFKVVDFEHFKLDYFLLDLCQMKARAWASEPGLAKAFFQGYGKRLNDWEAQLLQYWSLLWAYSTVLWSRDHGDKKYQKIGQKAIHFLSRGIA